MSNWRDDLIEKYHAPSIGHIEVGDGWRPLVEFAYEQVERTPAASVGQVKEKFGELRFYIDRDYTQQAESVRQRFADLEQTVWALEGVSTRICEQCGAYGQQRGGGWIRTLCDEHAGDRPPLTSD